MDSKTTMGKFLNSSSHHLDWLTLSDKQVFVVPNCLGVSKHVDWDKNHSFLEMSCIFENLFCNILTFWTTKMVIRNFISTNSIFIYIMYIFIHLFIYSFSYLFVYLFISLYIFIYLFIHSLPAQSMRQLLIF